MKTEAIHSDRNHRGLSKRWSRMSLRNRIAFYYTIATAFLIALVFTVIYFMVDNVVYRQFDEEIRKEISEIFTDSHINRNDFKGFSSFSEFDADHKSNDDEHENNKHDVDAEFIQIVNSAGTIIKKSENLSRNLLIFNPRHLPNRILQQHCWQFHSTTGTGTSCQSSGQNRRLSDHCLAT